MGQILLSLPWEAKVRNFCPHIDVEEYVASFYISMDDTRAASCVQILKPWKMINSFQKKKIKKKKKKKKKARLEDGEPKFREKIIVFH